MPLLPAELFFYTFPGEIDCPNPECANSLSYRADKHGNVAPLAPFKSYQTTPDKPSNSTKANQSPSQSKGNDSFLSAPQGQELGVVLPQSRSGVHITT